MLTFGQSPWSRGRKPLQPNKTGRRRAERRFVMSRVRSIGANLLKLSIAPFVDCGRTATAAVRLTVLETWAWRTKGRHCCWANNATAQCASGRSTRLVRLGFVVLVVLVASQTTLRSRLNETSTGAESKLTASSSLVAAPHYLRVLRAPSSAH